jgi:hypothetical protein
VQWHCLYLGHLKLLYWNQHQAHYCAAHISKDRAQKRKHNKIPAVQYCIVRVVLLLQ